MQKALLAIAVLACIAQPAASATRSDTTGAEAIILYERGDLDFIAYFLGLAEGMAWSNSYLQFKKTPLICAFPLFLFRFPQPCDQPSSWRAALTCSGVSGASLIVAGVEVFRGDRAGVDRLAKRFGE
jgi:hypothetical protein